MHNMVSRVELSLLTYEWKKKIFLWKFVKIIWIHLLVIVPWLVVTSWQPRYREGFWAASDQVSVISVPWLEIITVIVKASSKPFDYLTEISQNKRLRNMMLQTDIQPTNGQISLLTAVHLANSHVMKTKPIPFRTSFQNSWYRMSRLKKIDGMVTLCLPV